MKYKSINIAYGIVESCDWNINQSINSDGFLSGIGFFNFRTHEDRIRESRKYKNLYLSNGCIDEGCWQTIQKINYKGKIIGTGYFSLKTRDEAHRIHNNWSRRTRLGTVDVNGKTIKIKNLNKRDYPYECELCKVKNTILHYHHWIDDEYNVGVWVCMICHRLCELVDRFGKSEVNEMIKRYLDLKYEAEIQYCW